MIEFQDAPIPPRTVWTGTIHQGGKFSAIPVEMNLPSAIGQAVLAINSMLGDNYGIDFTEIDDSQYLLRGVSSQNGYPSSDPVHVYIIPTTISEV